MIDNVIMSSNNDPTYLDHWPRVARCWRMLGFNPVLAWITDDGSRMAELERFGSVVRLYPVPCIPDGNLAKVSRMILAQQLPGINMLSDVDMMPLAGDYFRTATAEYEPGTLLSLSSDAYKKWASPNRHPICYLVADSQAWTSLVNPCGMIEQDLIDSWRLPRGVDEKDAIEGSPFSDESLLQWMIGRWCGVVVKQTRGWTGNGIALCRVDRACWGWDENLAERGHYIDAHLPRPELSEHRLDQLEEHAR